ncbi:MAG: CDP-glycerol glycerophosphotransferase family protein [Candidatus Marinimicrobia bacterium]|nr:CDP-glycerol glycerophosphotransferase family protein [Candidatus Neomarinimicrobiota bacterium]
MKYLFFVTKSYSFPILEPVQDAVNKLGRGSVAWFTASTAKNHPPPGLRLTSSEEVLNYNPDAILVPGNIVPHFWPGLKVQIFHGIDDEPKGFYRITGFFDLYCTPGPDITTKFKQLARRKGHFLVEETGWPKLDPVGPMVNISDTDKRKLKKKYGLDPDQPVILYAPTFPPKYTSAPDLFQTIKGLKNRFQWLIKFHPLMNRDVQQQYQKLRNTNFIICEDLNIINYMSVADLLITDTSSVAYEFLAFDRPIITYRAIARQDKGINIIAAEELIGAIERAIAEPQEFSENRAKYRNKIHPYADGKSSNRIINYIENIIESDSYKQLKPKPRNWIRKRQIRKLIEAKRN